MTAHDPAAPFALQFLANAPGKAAGAGLSAQVLASYVAELDSVPGSGFQPDPATPIAVI